jgi:hypothetical protein
MVSRRFRVTIAPREPGSVIGIEVPFDVKEAFGRARPPVKVTINGHTFPTTIAVYGGRSYIGVRESNRAAADIDEGQVVNVEVAFDAGPRTVEPPPELARAFAKDRAAKDAWGKLSFTHRKEHADHITGAKKPETRASRVAKTLALLKAKKAKKTSR